MKKQKRVKVKRPVLDISTGDIIVDQGCEFQVYGIVDRAALASDFDHYIGLTNDMRIRELRGVWIGEGKDPGPGERDERKFIERAGSSIYVSIPV